MRSSARVILLAVFSLLMTFAAGYGLAQLDREGSEAAVPPLSVVCSASLGSLDRLRAEAAGQSAGRVRAAPVDAEIAVLSQQRLRLAQGGLDAPRRRLAVALDSALLQLSRAQRRVGGSDEVEAAEIGSAVTTAVSRVRAACPAP